jgi:hypothetical protein
MFGDIGTEQYRIVLYPHSSRIRLNFRVDALSCQDRSSVDAMDSSTADDVPPVKRRDASASSAQALTHSGIHTEQGKPEALPMGKRAVRQADRAAGKG